MQVKDEKRRTTVCVQGKKGELVGTNRLRNFQRAPEELYWEGKSHDGRYDESGGHGNSVCKARSLRPRSVDKTEA